MRRLAFIIFLISLGVLIFLVYSRDFQAVNSVQALENLSDGDLVYTVGFVEEQRVYSRDFSVLKLNNSIEVSCECEDWFEGETVEVRGFIGYYNDRLQIESLEIRKL